MKISATVYSNTHRCSIEELSNRLESSEVDYLFFDATARSSVLKDIEEVRVRSRRPIHLHLSASDPSEHLEVVHRLGIQRVSFEYEALEGAATLPCSSKETSYGLSLNENTSTDVLNRQDAQFVLLKSEAYAREKKLSSKVIHRIHRIRRSFPALQLEPKVSFRQRGIAYGTITGRVCDDFRQFP